MKSTYCALVALALVGCLKLGPQEEDVVRFVTGLQPKDAIAAGQKVEITKHRCHLMNHGQSHECAVDYRLSGGEAASDEQTPAKTIYLIVREVDGEWTLYSHRDKR